MKCGINLRCCTFPYMHLVFCKGYANIIFCQNNDVTQRVIDRLAIQVNYDELDLNDKGHI